GWSVALSGDGSTLAVGAYQEDSNATGIGGNQANNSLGNAGAAYVYTHDGLGVWSQQAYVKASNTGSGDFFGYSVALSADGSTLAVGADGEGSNATGIDGNQADNSLWSAGAVYVYTRDGVGAWSQQAYVKASNTDTGDWFGHSVAVSGDGSTLAVGAYGENSIATGIGGNEANNNANDAGAVYVYTRDGLGTWSQQAYVKASNTAATGMINDSFGHHVALNGDGSTLAVGAVVEGSNATGVGGNEADNSALASGAVYVLTRDGLGGWSQQAYVKASNTDALDRFGHRVALSDDGNTLAVAAYQEASNATGIGGDQLDDTSSNSGAVYLY
ncbi:MAG: integrin, partial [Nannocystaceae bacterium]